MTDQTPTYDIKRTTDQTSTNDTRRITLQTSTFETEESHIKHQPIEPGESHIIDQRSDNNLRHHQISKIIQQHMTPLNITDQTTNL